MAEELANDDTENTSWLVIDEVSDDGVPSDLKVQRVKSIL